ncbi:hypothetical protein MASR2M70_02420 [Bacillota bacterium]
MESIFSKMGLLFLSVVMLVMLGASYGSYTGILDVDITESTGSMDFLFAQGHSHEFSMTIQNGQMDEAEEIPAHFVYDDKTLKITDIGPINLNILREGDLRFNIRYSLKASEASSIKKAVISARSGNKKNEQKNLSFIRMSRTPEWTVICGNNMWGSAKAEAGGVPEIVYRLLPDTIGDFAMEQVLTIDEDEELLKGVIVLEQTGCKMAFPAEPVLLSSFELPEEIEQDMMEGEECQLIIKAAYSLEIPVDLDQFNYREIGL